MLELGTEGLDLLALDGSDLTLDLLELLLGPSTAFDAAGDTVSAIIHPTQSILYRFDTPAPWTT